MEEWKSIPGYEGKYEVSSSGSVRSVGRYIDAPNGRTRWLPQRILTASVQKKWGYCMVYLYNEGKAKAHLVHKLVALLFLDIPWSTDIDHIDRDKSNNACSNLRSTTQQLNNMNQGPQKNNSCGLKGVHWRRDMGVWRASIRVNRKLYHLGHFQTKEKAALAYNEAALHYFGDVAWLNPVDASILEIQPLLPHPENT
jgi:hypothetical protein